MSAIISACGKYRYRLDRGAELTGRAFGPRMTFIMINPSTADAELDDATIRKCRGFAQRHNCFRLTVGNLFALRATDVKELALADDPVGPDNDKYLRKILAESQAVVFAWGRINKVPRHLQDRWKAVWQLAQTLKRDQFCLGVCDDGHPRHPLMLAYDTPLELWNPPS